MIINTQEDLNAITGTSEYEQFIATLRGSLFTVRKDEVTQKWVADENNETIERFGLTRADFDPIALPTLPRNETDAELLAKVVAEEVQTSLTYLASTDHKFLVGYKAKEGEDLVAIEAARDVAREFIRNSGV